MSNISCLFDTISSGGFDRAMTTLYGEQNLPHQRERWCRLLEQYNELFADSDTPRLFSAPGRTEISGNHTDHEGGHVIAGSLDVAVDGIAVATDSNKVRVADVGGVMPDADAHAEGTLGLGVFGFLDIGAGDGEAAAVQDLDQRIGAGAAAADEVDRADAFEQLGVIHTKNHNSGHLKIYPLP